MKEEIKKTSAEWMKEEAYKDVIIIDPDGWNRENYDYSFNIEEVTLSEFFNRLARSTSRFKQSKIINETR